ncbi:MAG: hypothetical protein CVU42_01480 [Chloroflexi bacterium HGW-Chloroflexi-4]|jgi:hypothetical protein|nr:MAG: hypothetical protein CVU42_01480 [Chloroflexi bacterium HGW-Chloroflexi-4]
MFFLLGIDDTDSPAMEDAPNSTQDTAALALVLGQKMESLGLAKLLNISCHELFQNPSIAHTNSNTAYCLLLDSDPQKMREIDMTTRLTLRGQSAATANPGYALASWNQIDPEVVVWGQRAKISILQRMDAISLARRSGIAIAGISGSGIGVIGALSAIGLRYDGNDGYINWMPGLDRLAGIHTQIEINHFIQFASIETEHQKRPALDDRILFNANTKPILKNGRIIVKVYPADNKQTYHWQS